MVQEDLPDYLGQKDLPVQSEVLVQLVLLDLLVLLVQEVQKDLKEQPVKLVHQVQEDQPGKEDQLELSEKQEQQVHD